MKRPSRPKRRQRRTGESPYAKYNKAPYLYSAGYKQWKAKHLRANGRADKAKEVEQYA